LLDATAIDNARPPWLTLGGVILTGEDVHPAKTKAGTIAKKILRLTILNSSPTAGDRPQADAHVLAVMTIGIEKWRGSARRR